MIYERNTHFAYFMRKETVLDTGTPGNKMDLGPLSVHDQSLQAKANEIGAPSGLVAALTNEKMDLCILRFSRRLKS